MTDPQQAQPPAWSDDLPTFATEFQPFFADSAAVKKSARIGIDRDLVIARRTEKRRLLNLLHVSNAAATLDRIPAPGETFHVIAGGNWSGFALILAAIKLADCKIRWLRLATLSYSRDNVKALTTLLDEGTVQHVGFIYSVYFRSTSQDEASQLHDALEDRGHRAAALRMHAKITLIEFADGRKLAIEASANLRSSNNIEHFTITQDAALHDFHAAWLDHLLDRSAREDPSIDGTIIPRRKSSPPIDTTAAVATAETSPPPEAIHAPRPQTKTHRAQAARRKSRQAPAKPRRSKTSASRGRDAVKAPAPGRPRGR